MTPERVDQITAAIAKLQENIGQAHLDLVDFSFDVGELATYLDNTLSTEELRIVGNVYGLTFRHNGDYCWFDKKTDADDK